MVSTLRHGVVPGKFVPRAPLPGGRRPRPCGIPASKNGFATLLVRAERRVEEDSFWRRRPPNFPPSDKGPSGYPPFYDEEEDQGRDYPFDATDASRGAATPPLFRKYSESQSKFGKMNSFVLASVFVIGIGAGVMLDSVINVEPSNVASREVIDQKTPNPDICLANGMSAMVLDQRLFISFNPFNVYVSQAEVKPGCVLRQSNWQVLESRGLITNDEARDCKRNMNTFGFVGDLRRSPEVSCIYHSENAENQFLVDPNKAALGDGFQPKDFND